MARASVLVAVTLMASACSEPESTQKPPMSQAFALLSEKLALEGITRLELFYEGGNAYAGKAVLKGEHAITLEVKAQPTVIAYSAVLDPDAPRKQGLVEEVLGFSSTGEVLVPE